MDHAQKRKEFNAQKSKYKKTHTPQCKRCGFFSPWESGQHMQIHHIKALVDGGENEETNLVVLCQLCHLEWHNFAEGHMDFMQFLNSVPYCVIGALMGYNKKFGDLGCGLDDVNKGWPYIKDCIMTRQPFKDEYCANYTKTHCKYWIDW